MISAKSFNKSLMRIILEYRYTHNFPRYLKINTKVTLIVRFSFIHSYRILSLKLLYIDIKYKVIG